MIEAPVLLITFNRPDTTQKMFEAIKKVEPKKLYVFNDGPRADKPGEEKLCDEVRKIVQYVDWDCRPHYNFRNRNLGCKDGVVKAISWVLEMEDRVIIVEDDVVPVIPFFYYAQELLERYKNDERIAMISGNNYSPIKTIDCDYYFSKYGHIWGWATWKRVWDKFDVNVPDLRQTIDTGILDSLIPRKRERIYFKTYFEIWLMAIKNKTINAWGPQFFYFRLRNNLLSIVPRINLSTNIGFEGTHNSGKSDAHLWPVDESFVLLKHPVKVRCNTRYDKYHFKKHIDKRRPLTYRILHLIVRVYNKAVRILRLR